MNLASTTYRTESELVADLMQHLGKDGFAIGSEFNYSRGKTDVVVLDGGTGEVSAIEAKLTRWRVALHQAYRNTCFAHRSYVALPVTTAALAARYSAEFLDRSVGILAVSKDGVEVLLEAAFAVPVQGWLTDVAIASVKGRELCSPPKLSD
jgi:hypothetical protein